MNVTQFHEKLNKLENNIYVIEEVVKVLNGVYESELQHDNVNLKTLNVYTGSKLTGNKIEAYFTSTPSLTPWKTIIKIYSNVSPIYISYETLGDQVEAEDVNKLQDAVVETQENLNSEINRATGAEKVLTDNLNTEISRAKSSENTLTINLNSEITRAKSAESILTTNLDFEINRAKTKESSIDAELSNRYTKDKVYTKDEVLQKISELINNAPNVLDTFKEIADALGNDPNFATTMTTMLAGKVDKISGKGLSTNDYTDTEKANLADTNNKKHEHGNKSVIDGITVTLIGYWNAAYTHITDSVKHITSDERTLWNTVSNKVDKITGKSLSTNDFDNNYKGKIDGISSNANKVEVSTTNGNIKIDGAEKTVYTHPSGTNPHGTTKTDVGLGNVTNDSQVKRSEMGAANGVATLDSSGVNNQAPKPHTHDDRYYTETEADNKFATKDQISQAGYGDMLKSVYDTNNNGVVDKAEKLSTARKINLNGDVTGSVIFDGSEDASITTSSRQIAFIGSDAASSNGWYKVASQTMNGYGNTNIMFAVCSTYGNYYAGILELQMRTDNTSISCRALTWLSKYGFNINHFIIVISGMTWTLYVYRDFGQYGRLAFEILSSSSIGNKQQAWALNFSDNNTKETNDPTATTISSDVKKTLTWTDLKGV
ncbi:uncharacterized protein YdcH (DUF465 family) [Clostridium beijerinckii]|uniref:hypothetical protein n=1 Tax=Clostridium beijerinckii TaxID=1520 RepID=UPI001F4C3BEE|nr:hypothetical protein [Clostridium beijerinckii]NRT32448.1 uncharacterized protein YdcH (DUF465 family) [Clostridium beijerinckii]NRT48124.1 uncharacterized protein YdcH (DUF465 family) [Clostridium beijerinckii]NRZ23579.1 uncharacterized protein YdcH (DUF465 family) [Clostridium beijerinckii]